METEFLRYSVLRCPLVEASLGEVYSWAVKKREGKLRDLRTKNNWINQNEL